MQKPQQRKYHSSCNRSVHRGTAHGKQEVKVCKRKTPHLFLMRSFLSPYGDCTGFRGNKVVKFRFSPPYGDSTQKDRRRAVITRFSPPYGDDTYRDECNVMAILLSPPYGDGTKTVQVPEYLGGFSPPYGDGTLNISQNIVKWKN